MTRSDDSEAAEAPEDCAWGGALRFNAFYKSWDGEEANQETSWVRSRLRHLDASMSTLGPIKGIDFSATVPPFTSGYNMLHHGYFGYTFKRGYARSWWE